MATFTQLDENNIVTSMLVVNNDVIQDENGDEQESLGIAFLKNLYGNDTIWKQTSITNSFRKQYAEIGFFYDSAKDKFIGPQPHSSWSLDSNDDWKAPVSEPTIGSYGDPPKIYIVSWNEDNLRWQATDQEEPVNNYYWKTDTSSWEQI
tara:strand:- start:1931 stop:2377 length:447 start_codon:yes stop_codon:yes gene_type:complete